MVDDPTIPCEIKSVATALASSEVVSWELLPPVKIPVISAIFVLSYFVLIIYHDGILALLESMGKYLTLFKRCGIICHMKYLILSVVVVLLIIVGVLGFRLNRASQGDINHDGVVNILDMSILSKNWGKQF